MNRYALIVNGIVVNVIEQSSLPTIPGQWVLCAATVGPGDTYSGGVFARPVVVAIRQITQLAYLSRFTDDEAVAIDLASIGATDAAARIRRYQAIVAASPTVNLDLAGMATRVQALRTAGLLTTPRAAAILSGAVQDNEKS